MPNHVHVLIQQKEGFPLGLIVSSWKKYSAKKIREVLNNKEVQHVEAVESGAESKKHLSFIDDKNVFTKNSLWQKGYWDRFIRDENHYMKVIEYIVYNPVKANLVKHYQDWPFSGVNPE